MNKEGYNEGMSFHITTRQREPGITVIEIGGRITLGRESGQIETVVMKALNDGSLRLVFDLSKLAYIDSTGMGTIAYCIGKISQKGARAAIAGTTEVVFDVFKLMRLDSVIRFFPDVASACGGLTATGAST